MIMSAQERKPIFPEVSSSIWVSIMFSIAFLITLFFLSEQRTANPNPMYLFTIGFLLLVIMAMNSTNFKKLKTVLGFDSPYPGYNLFLGILGVGLAFMIYGLITLPMSVLSVGNKLLMSYVIPFYLPLSAEPYSLMVEKSVTFFILLYLVVGFFEEMYKMLLFKNISNYLNTRISSQNLSLVLGFIGSVVLWGTYHYFSWGGLTLFSILFAVIYGLLFWLTYFIPDSMGLLSPEIPIDWKNVMIIGAISCHTTWDVLVSMQELPIQSSHLVILGLIMVAVSLLSMWIVRRYYVKFYTLRSAVA